MRKNQTWRDIWSKTGIWVGVFLVVNLFPLPMPPLAPFPHRADLAALCLTLSIATFFEMSCRRFAFTRFYAPYVVKWLSEFVGHFFVSFLLFGLIGIIALTSLFASQEGNYLILLFVIPFPLIRLYTNVREDLTKLSLASPGIAPLPNI